MNLLADVDEALLAREEQLRAALRETGGALVAFSAGVDSTYLLAVAHEELGDAAEAVTADSPSLARRSLAEAEAFCRERGIRHRVVATDEFDDADYQANTGLRCYACKAALFRAMHAIRSALPAERERTLVLGALVEDFDDYRPGLQAAREAGARWPLADAGLSKPMVRALSRRLGLASWDRPAEPCLASRLPYGEVVTREALAMVEGAERILNQAGLRECRARHHRIGGGKGALCRIEVPEADLERVLAARSQLVPAIRELGYHAVSLDLAGLRSGGFNELL